MKLLLTAIIIAAGLALAFTVGDIHSELTEQNVLAGILGGLVASVGLAWGLRS
jgi:hypothetical protein